MSAFHPLRTLAPLIIAAWVKALLFIVASLSALASLTLVAVLQLIYASSELSYYVQLALATAGIAGIVIVAARASLLTIIGVVVISATVATLMPVETVVESGEPSEFALALAQLWLTHAFLQALFAIGINDRVLRLIRSRM